MFLVRVKLGRCREQARTARHGPSVSGIRRGLRACGSLELKAPDWPTIWPDPGILGMWPGTGGGEICSLLCAIPGLVGAGKQ